MISRYSAYLQSIRKATESVKTYIPVFDQTFQQLMALYPAFQLPKTFFSIGFMNLAGRSLPDTTGQGLPDNALYVGAEFSCVSDYPNYTGTPSWLPSVTTSIKRVNELVAHESIHMQQKRPPNGQNTLLYYAWTEGGAVLAVDLITNGKGLLSVSGLNKRTYDFGIAHEKELWADFKQDLTSGDAAKQTRWFYNAPTEERPKDLGYFLGYRMCLAYYNQAKNKKQAIKEIITETNYSLFLKRSRYEEQLAK